MPDESGDVLRGQVGVPVRILLESTPGTGAAWYVAETSPALTVERRDSVRTSDGVGGPVLQVFEFLPPAAGTYELSFHLKRAWETTVRREKHVVVQVDQ